jgi:hypothetical protein
MQTFGTNTVVGGLDMKNFMEDSIIEGLRIPAQLNSVAATNFVLTQEKGKLKPKDLKAAIERNRADKKRRAAEQEKIRKEGGGVGPGMLDLRSILADDRLNLSEGDAFKRQLREMAFLADVEDVQKLEVEKSFRVSEVYLGSPHLTQEDIETVLQQREEAALFKKRTEWRSVQERMNTELHPPHSEVRAGAPLDVSQTCQGTLTPHFDANRNDIWAKRMNTLRKFMSLVGRWIMRKRIVNRMDTFRRVFEEAGCFTKAEVQDYITQENANYRSKGAGVIAKTTVVKEEVKIAWADVGKENAKPKTLAELVCSMPNEVLIKRAEDELKSFEKYEVTADMVRRVLYPKYTSDETAERQPVKAPTAMKDDCKFDDKTYFQLKVRPEYLALRCSKHEVPVAPITFSACNNKIAKIGAPEEYSLRYPADKHVDCEEILMMNPFEEPPAIAEMPVPAAEQKLNELGEDVSEPYVGEFTAPASWLADEPVWNANEINYFRTRPHYRTYSAAPLRNEVDPDYVLRPYARPLLYDQDNSLRSKWLKNPGFGSANVYLMGAYETRDSNISKELLPPPAPGPTLIDFYFPDHDRHTSGLNCFEVDHYRGLHDHDSDVRQLQQRQDAADHLTDSESDEEDAYQVPKPTVRRIRKLLSAKEEEPVAPPPVETGGKQKSMASVPGKQDSVASMVSVNVPGDASAADEESVADDSVQEQVELLRDRKTLDMESYLLKLRQKGAEDIANRLKGLSSASMCLVQRLPVQMPFHTYENDVNDILEREERKPVLTNTYIEPGVLSGKTKIRNPATGIMSPGGDDMSIFSGGDMSLRSPA